MLFYNLRGLGCIENLQFHDPVLVKAWQSSMRSPSLLGFGSDQSCSKCEMNTTVSNFWLSCRKSHRWTWQVLLNGKVVFSYDLFKSSPEIIFAPVAFINSLCSVLTPFFFKKVQGWLSPRSCYFRYQSHFPVPYPSYFPESSHVQWRKNQKMKHFPFSLTIQGTTCLLIVKWKKVNDICLLIKLDSWIWIYPQDFIIIKEAWRSGINRLISNPRKKVLIRECVILPSDQFGKKTPPCEWYGDELPVI